MERRNVGKIRLGDGYTFYWQRGSGDGEVQGHVERPRGGIVKGTGGWYRTTDPEVAADIAKRKIGQK